MDSSALLDATVRSRTTPAEQEAKASPTPVVKSKKTPSITAKSKSPALIGRAKKLSLDKTTVEKGAMSPLWTSFHFNGCYLVTLQYLYLCTVGFCSYGLFSLLATGYAAPSLRYPCLNILTLLLAYVTVCIIIEST